MNTIVNQMPSLLIITAAEQVFLVTFTACKASFFFYRKTDDRSVSACRDR